MARRRRGRPRSWASEVGIRLQALEELSDAPRPDAAGRVEADHRSSRVKGTDLVLHYTVDERMGRVEVLSVTVGARRSEAEDEPS